MRWQLRRIVAAALVGCGSMASMTAGAQTSGSAISFARADGLVEKPLVKSAIDLSRATPLPLPSIDLPVTPEAILQLAQAPAPPSKPALDIHDTGNPSVAPLKWVGLVMTKTDQTHFSYCTGQFIAPRVVLTAGHCVKDTTTNTWHDVNAMSFILQYQNGEGSHVYKVVCTAALDAYSLPAGYSALNADQKNAAFLTAAQADFADRNHPLAGRLEGQLGRRNPDRLSRGHPRRRGHPTGPRDRLFRGFDPDFRVKRIAVPVSRPRRPLAKQYQADPGLERRRLDRQFRRYRGT